jgi:hypothetical protein
VSDYARSVFPTRLINGDRAGPLTLICQISAVELAANFALKNPVFSTACKLAVIICSFLQIAIATVWLHG